MTRKNAHSNGFTLVEVIIVLVIMGILTAVIATRGSDSRANLVGQTEVVKSHLRYAQSRAMSTEAWVWGIVMDGNNDRYWLFWCNMPPGGGCQNNNIAVLPGTTPDAQNRVSLAAQGIAIAGGRRIIAFDHKGRPYVDNAAVLNSLLAATATITLQDAAGNTDSIQITPETGYIP